MYIDINTTEPREDYMNCVVKTIVVMKLWLIERANYQLDMMEDNKELYFNKQ